MRRTAFSRTHFNIHSYELVSQFPQVLPWDLRQSAYFLRHTHVRRFIRGRSGDQANHAIGSPKSRQPACGHVEFNYCRTTSPQRAAVPPSASQLDTHLQAGSVKQFPDTYDNDHKQKGRIITSPAQTTTLKRTWNSRFPTTLGLFFVQRWLLWMFHTPSCVKHASSLSKKGCVNIICGVFMYTFVQLHPYRKIIWKGLCPSGVMLRKQRTFQQVIPERWSGQPSFSRDATWASPRYSFHSCSYGVFIGWCPYTPWVTSVLKYSRCYTCWLTEALLQSSVTQACGWRPLR